MEHLPFVLLGLRTSVREDSACSSSDLLYGTSLRLPGDMVTDSTAPAPLASDFALSLRASMRQASPMPVVYHGTPPARLCPHLAKATHVFLRVDAVKRPLTPPYEGPFLVQKRSAKTFVVIKNGKPQTVSIDRLKPAFSAAADLPAPPRPVVSDGRSSTVATSAPAAAASTPSAAPAAAVPPSPSVLDPDAWPLPTRYGRRPRPPDRLNL